MSVPIENIIVAPCLVEVEPGTCIPRLDGDDPEIPDIPPPTTGGNKVCLGITVIPGGVLNLGFGSTSQLLAKANYSDGSIKDVTLEATWSSSNPSKVGVGETGIISALDAGTANIFASLLGCGSGSTTVVVDALSFDDDEDLPCEPESMAIAVVLDASLSMSYPAGNGLNKLQMAIQATANLVDSLPKDGTSGILSRDFVSVIAFMGGLREGAPPVYLDLVSGWDTDAGRIKENLSLFESAHLSKFETEFCETYGSCGTGIGAGIQMAGTGGVETGGGEYECGDPNGNGLLCTFGGFTGDDGEPVFPKKIMVLLTDGIETSFPPYAATEAQKAKDAGILLIVVGIGGAEAEMSFMKSLASPGYYFHVPSLQNDLSRIFSAIPYYVCKGNEAGEPIDSGVVGEGPAGGLHGLRWQMPCKTPLPQFSGCTCVDPNPVTAVMAGGVGVSYDVVLRIRGKVELKTYTKLDLNAAADDVNGISDGPDSFVFRGGQANEALLPLYNRYSLEISGSQNKKIWLNAVPPNLYPSFLGWQSKLFILDYQFTVRIKEGDNVTLKAVSVDGAQLADKFGAPCVVYGGGSVNCVVPGIPPDPALYVGQFLQMDVVSATPV